MTTVMIVDDQEVVRRGLRLLLEVPGVVDVIAEAADARTALTLVRTGDGSGPVRPDVVLLDARMPRMSGMELIPLLRAELPELRILMLSTFDEDEVVLGSLRAGANGFFLKDASPEELHKGIDQAVAGRTVIDPRVGARVVSALVEEKQPSASDPNASLIDQLTGRELQVVELVVEGASNRRISRILHLTEGTVKNHVSAALRKTGSRSRTELARWWRTG